MAATAPPASIIASAKTKTIFFMPFSLRIFSQMLLKLMLLLNPGNNLG
ncbi:MAG: hypothetical protein HY790_03605 [Deltaproteobacteria bacterium]|nr:hypothetical protein [Deltaproteobacteria bacterium]MBI4794917.1 hypothetical protein [Deltaproteobacteria bacterium]